MDNNFTARARVDEFAYNLCSISYQCNNLSAYKSRRRVKARLRLQGSMDIQRTTLCTPSPEVRAHGWLSKYNSFTIMQNSSELSSRRNISASIERFCRSFAGRGGEEGIGTGWTIDSSTRLLFPFPRIRWENRLELKEGTLSHDRAPQI